MVIISIFLIVYLAAIYINQTHKKPRVVCKIHSWGYSEGLLKCNDCGYTPSKD